MNGLKQLNGKILIWLGVLVVITVMLLPLSSEIKLEITYLDRELGEIAALYCCDENGVIDIKHDYVVGNNCKNYFVISNKNREMTYLRYDPVEQKKEGVIKISQIDIFCRDGLIKSYSATELKEALIPQKDIEILECDELGLTFLPLGKDPQFVFSDEVMQKLSFGFYRNYAQRILCLVVVLFAIWVISQQGFQNTQNRVLSMLHVVYYIWYAVEITMFHGQKAGFWVQTCIWITISVLLCVVRNKYKSNSYRPTAIALPFAVTVLAEITYGLPCFEKVMSGKNPEIILGLIAWSAAFGFLVYVLWNGKAVTQYMLVISSVSVFHFFFMRYGLAKEWNEAFEGAFHYQAGFYFVITTLALVGLYMLLRGLLGDGIAIISYSVLWLVFFVGNFIIMIFHQSVIKPLDFLFIKEAWDVAENFIDAKVIILFCLIVCGLFFVLKKYSSKILAFLKPKRSAASVVLGCLLLFWVFSSLEEDVYKEEWYMTKSFTWETEFIRLELQGMVPFFYYHCRRVSDLFPEEPEGYSKQLVDNILKNGQDAEKTVDDEQKPDVLYIMLESIFDVDDLRKYGVEFSQDPDAVMDNYQIATAVSPVYGGLTARAEFEGLTGLTGSFYPPGNVEFLTFWGSEVGDKYALPAEFVKNGYETVAIHQNKKAYYNRNIVYDSIGIERYVGEEDYGEVLEEEYHNGDNYLTNTHYMNLIKEELEADTEKPKFLWGITIESHSPYHSKYSESEIKVQCDALDVNATQELEKYVQSVKRTDEFVEGLIAYVEKREKPTILVMFGDHRPPLAALDQTGANADGREQYNAVCLAYSNYKDIEVEQEYLSISYIPAVVARNAGLNSPFYNYLDKMRYEYPVVADVFDTPEFEKRRKEYEILQYDILFGKGYCARD